MPELSPITPPHAEPAPFDFWEWRSVRRQVIDLLLTLATSMNASTAATLRRAAEEMETETIGPDLMRTVCAIVRPHDPSGIQTSTDLHGALLDRLPPDTRIRSHADTLLAVRPDWDAIQQSHADLLFAGRIGVPGVVARLRPTRQVVPEYSVLWLHGTDEGLDGAYELPLLHAQVGWQLNQGPLAWDWLFARRLTLLCERRIGQWPEVSDPLVLDTSRWHPLPRAL